MDKATRKQFLQTAGAVASGPIIPGASNRSGSQKPILGEGDHKYDCKPMLLVADRGNKRLQYFTLDGKVHSFAGNVKSPSCASSLKSQSIESIGRLDPAEAYMPQVIILDRLGNDA